MTGCSYRERYNTYPWDTSRIEEEFATTRIIAPMEWYDRAKARMAELGLTQDDLKQIFGVTTRGGVGHYLNNLRKPSPEVLLPLADRLGMTLDELLRGTPPPPARSQSARLDPEMLAESIEALRRIYQRRGKTYDPVQQPEVLAYAYELRCVMGEEPTQDQLIDFGVKLAERLRANEGVGDGREKDKQAGGVDRARTKGHTGA